MSAPGRSQLVIAETIEELERLAHQAAVVVEFDSRAAEQASEKVDWRLHLQICDVMGMTDSSDRSDLLVHLIEDWWPDQSRYMEVDATALGPDQVKSRRALLHGEFRDWAIHMSVYRGFTNDIANDRPEFIVGVAIYATRVVVQRTVLHACGLERLSPT